MKIISVDYDSINTLSGISTFNRNLKLIFATDVEFLTVYKSMPLFDICESNMGWRKGFFNKLTNYFSGYRIFPFLMAKEIKKRKPDVLIVNSPSFLRYINQNEIKKIILVQHQDFNIMLTNKSNFASDHQFMLRSFEKITNFVALSDNDAKHICGFLPEELHHKVVAINHMSSISCEYFEGKIRTYSLVMIGRLDIKQKRYDLAIRAMKCLPNWTMSIYGDGDDKKRLEKILIDENIKNVSLKGVTNNVEFALKNHDIHVMTSDFEGYSLTNIEAMSCGLPLIVRDTFTSASDCFSGNGVLLSSTWSEDEFVRAVEIIDKNYREYSRNSFQYSKKYSPEIIKSKWHELINS